MATVPADRIQSLDIIRGIAVMGIFSVNVVGMAMIENAYFFPPDYGFASLADRIMWAANFIIVDGKFRSLFSILFGASMVLVIERGIANGKAGWQVHFPRMIVLLGFGAAHYYLLWWGDILVNYALVGMIAFMFWRLHSRLLVLAGITALALFYGPTLHFGTQQIARYQASAAPDATAAQTAELEELKANLYSSADEISTDKQAHSTLSAHLRQSVTGKALMRPWQSVPGYGLETLGLMLLGMAGYKSGFLTGAWSRRSYALVALVCTGTSLAYFGISAWLILRSDFDPFIYFPLDQMWSSLFHPVAAIGYSAVFILLLAAGRSAVADRLAAVGRTAFTNYLGATLFGIMVFYDHGFGLYGEVSRGQAWLLAPPLWAIMLLWSKPWLDRFRYGPFEWAWRSLSRWKWEPMRKVAPVLG